MDVESQELLKTLRQLMPHTPPYYISEPGWDCCTVLLFRRIRHRLKKRQDLSEASCNTIAREVLEDLHPNRIVSLALSYALKELTLPIGYQRELGLFAMWLDTDGRKELPKIIKATFSSEVNPVS